MTKPQKTPSSGELAITMILIAINAYYAYDPSKFRTDDFIGLLLLDVAFPMLALPLGISNRGFVRFSTTLFLCTISFIVLCEIMNLASA